MTATAEKPKAEAKKYNGRHIVITKVDANKTLRIGCDHPTWDKPFKLHSPPVGKNGSPVFIIRDGGADYEDMPTKIHYKTKFKSRLTGAEYEEHDPVPAEEIAARFYQQNAYTEDHIGMTLPIYGTALSDWYFLENDETRDFIRALKIPVSNVNERIDKLREPALRGARGKIKEGFAQSSSLPSGKSPEMAPGQIEAMKAQMKKEVMSEVETEVAKVKESFAKEIEAKQKELAEVNSQLEAAKGEAGVGTKKTTGAAKNPKSK